jgi:hypothetical protein
MAVELYGAAVLDHNEENDPVALPTNEPPGWGRRALPTAEGGGYIKLTLVKVEQSTTTLRRGNKSSSDESWRGHRDRRHHWRTVRGNITLTDT